jgi:hypothetical protein
MFEKCPDCKHTMDPIGVAHEWSIPEGSFIERGEEEDFSFWYCPSCEKLRMLEHRIVTPLGVLSFFEAEEIPLTTWEREVRPETLICPFCECPFADPDGENEDKGYYHQPASKDWGVMCEDPQLDLLGAGYVKIHCDCEKDEDIYIHNDIWQFYMGDCKDVGWMGFAKDGPFVTLTPPITVEAYGTHVGHKFMPNMVSPYRYFALRSIAIAKDPMLLPEYLCSFDKMIRLTAEYKYKLLTEKE